MNKKPYRRKTDPILIIGYIIIAIFMAIGFLSPRGDPEVSPMRAFELDMVRLIADILGLVGVMILFIYAIIQVRKQYACPSCGAKAQSKDDKFCRVCGAPFPKNFSS
jgi:hypothetical protein